MIQGSIANRGKAFLASVVLALFVFGVVQMLISTWRQTFFSDFSACVGFTNHLINLLLQLCSIHRGVSASFTGFDSMRISVLSYRFRTCFLSRSDAELICSLNPTSRARSFADCSADCLGWFNFSSLGWQPYTWGALWNLQRRLDSRQHVARRPCRNTLQFR